MGATYGWASKSGLVRELRSTRFKTPAGVRVSALRSELVGRHLWRIIEVDSGQGTEPTREIDLCLLSIAGGLWGYKQMSEAAGPYYYDCPADMLDETIVLSAAWRAGVREYHLQREAGNTASAYARASEAHAAARGERD